MAKINNFIKIDGEYVAQQDIPQEQMGKIARAIAVNLAKGFGYVPAEKDGAIAKSQEETNAQKA